MRVRVGNVELAVAQAGEGGRPLLIVHGFGGVKEDFTEVLPALAQRGWHAVTFDLRGHGASDRPLGEEHYSFEVYVRDCIDLANTLYLMGAEEITPQLAVDTLHVLLKYQSDIEKATVELTSGSKA